MRITIFDLDHTVIDSSHRQVTKPDGSLDLDHWIENCTRERILEDSLLPLADEMRARFKAGHRIVICTARVMSPYDYEFLQRNNLPFDFVRSRGANDARPDAILKRDHIQRLAIHLNARLRDMEMFDDNQSVIAMVRAMGVTCYDAKEENARRG